MTVFLSYSSKDEKQAKLIAKALEDREIPYFMASKDLRAGDHFVQNIRRELADSSALFLLLSPSSLKSDWVHFEWGAAFALDKRIVPILHRCDRADLPARLQLLQVADVADAALIAREHRDLLKKAAQRDRAIDEAIDEVLKAIDRKLEPHGSVFATREDHYREEKSTVASGYSTFLERRIRNLRSKRRKNIRIIFDSGTTIAPVLDCLGRRAESNRRYFLNRRDDRLRIYTNNLRGVQNLLRYRTTSSRNQPDRYAEIPFDCTVLPGRILSVYQALADEDTVRALFWLKRGGGTYTISVLTGNYVVLGPQRTLLPLARAGYHPTVKAVLYAISDEVHVLAPLGKIVGRASADATDLPRTVKDLNRDLGYSARARLDSMKPYQLVESTLLRHFSKTPGAERSDIAGDHRGWSKKSILVTSQRIKDEHLFHSRYREISEQLSPLKARGPHPQGGPYLLACSAPDLPISRHRQLEAEVPHENLRSNELTERYFGLTAG